MAETSEKRPGARPPEGSLGARCRCPTPRVRLDDEHRPGSWCDACGLQLAERTEGDVAETPRTARDWLSRFPDECARAVLLDPPYSTTPNSVRGRDDGAAGTSGAPYRLLLETLSEVRRVLVPGGIAPLICDWRRLPDVAYLASTTGLRLSTTVAWTRKRPGTGGLFRTAWDPILILSSGTPDAVDRAATPNWVQAEPPTKRRHPYQKPPEIWAHVLRRVPPGLVLDPFCGSATSREACAVTGHEWRGFDVDPRWNPPRSEREGAGVSERPCPHCHASSGDCPVHDVTVIPKPTTNPEPSPEPVSDVLSSEINSLPKRVRDFVHDLEARADPAGDVRTIHAQRDNIDGLSAMLVRTRRRLQVAEAELAEMRERDRLLRHECAQCKAALVTDIGEPPHCTDCVVDEEHREAWEDAVGQACLPPHERGPRR